MIFAAYFILKGHDTHFSAVIVVSGRHDLFFNARAFFFTSFQMQCFSLRLIRVLGCLIFFKKPHGSE